MRALVPLNLLLVVFLLLVSCGQNSNITLDNSENAVSALSVSMNAFSSFTYTFDQKNSLPDLSWQINDNNTGAPYAGSLNYSYAVGTVAVGSVPGSSANESITKPWASTGSSAPSLGAGVQGLSPGIYYMNLEAIDPATGAVVATDSVRFEVLASGSTQASVAVSGPAGGSSTIAGAAETVTGTCSPNGSTVTVSGASLSAGATGTCSAGVFSIPVVMSSSLVPGAQPQIDVSNGSATAAVVLNVPQASAPSVAITGPDASTYHSSLGMGATSPQQELVVSCTSGDSISVSGEISGVSPALPVLCPVGGVLNFSFDYANNTVSGAAGLRFVQVSATNSVGLTSYDSAVYSRAPGAPTITAPAAAATVGLTSTITGACAAGAVVSISNSNLSPNPTTGICAGDNTYSIPLQFSALTTGSQTLSATQTASGLTSAAATSSVVVDSSRPSLSMLQTSPYVGHNGSSPFDVSVSFSENVTGLSASDFVVVGGTASLSGGSQNYILTITPTANTAITVDLAANLAQSTLTGNGNIAATQLSIPYDGVLPTISITSTVGSVTNTSPIPISISFSESVLASTVSVGDFTVSSGTIGSFSCLPASPSTFYSTCSFSVTGMTANTNLVVGVNSTATVSDLAQNLSVAPNTASLTILYDTAAPSVAITTPAGINNSNNTSYSVTGTCSEIGSDVAVSIGSISVTPAPLCGAGGTWIASGVDVSTLSNGSVTITATQTDAAGNSGSATPVNVTKDTTMPTISSVAATSGFPAVGNTIGASTTSLSVEIVFSENMASSGAGAITAADFVATNATVTSVSCSSATLCTVVLNTSASAGGTVSLALATSPAAVIQDVAGNNLSGGMSSTSWTMDKTAPTVTISSSAASPTATSPIPIKLTWSELISHSSLIESDITIGNGAVDSGSLSCNDLPSGTPTHTECTLTVTPVANGTVTVDLAASKATDLASNANTAASQFLITYSAGTTYSSASESCNGVAVDTSGNVYCAGSTFGSLAETSGGAEDFFIAKFDSNGDLAWIRQAGNVGSYTHDQLATLTSSNGGGDTSGPEFCNDVAVDSSGNVYCAGSTFGSLAETSGGPVDFFIAKFDSNGDLAWIRQAGNAGGYTHDQITTLTSFNGGGDTSSDDYCNAVAVDSFGDVYCAGYTTGSLAANSGGADFFVTKFNSNGDVVWIRQSGVIGSYTQNQIATLTSSNGGGDTLGSEFCYDVAVDNSGNVYCAGGVAGSVAEARSVGGTYDFFIIKFDSNGDVVWTRQSGDTGGYTHDQIVTLTSSNGGGDTSSDENCHGVAVDSVGNVYCAGYVNGGSLAETAGGNLDFFIAKFDVNGDLAWIRQAGAPSVPESGTPPCGDNDSDGYDDCDPSGTYQPAIPGGYTHDQITTLTSSNGGGNTSNYEFCKSVAADDSGNAYCAGYTYGSLAEAFGGGRDFFIAKFDINGDLAWIRQAGSAGGYTQSQISTLTSSNGGGVTSSNDHCQSVAVDSSGNVYCAGGVAGSLAEAAGGGDDLFVTKFDSNGDLAWMRQAGAAGHYTSSQIPPH